MSSLTLEAMQQDNLVMSVARTLALANEAAVVDESGEKVERVIRGQ